MTEFWAILATGYYIYLIVTAIYLLLENREPTDTLLWLIVFVVFPFLGFFVYLLIGRDKRWIKRTRKFETQFIEKTFS